jgi:Anti-sigma factor NepR
MTKMSGKPKPGEDPPSVESGQRVSDHGGKDSDMQISRGNGADDPGPAPVVGEDIQKHLGRKLKASYDELVRQPVPDKFRQLLEELERQEKKQ